MSEFKLGVQDILEIEAKFVGTAGQRDRLAGEYGVSKVTICRILNGNYFTDGLARRADMFGVKAKVWTAERTAKLEELWATTGSAAVIAKELGAGLTKSAVVGKANRLKLPPRAFAASDPAVIEQRKEKHRNQVRSRRNSRAPDKPIPEAAPDPVEHRNLTFAEVGRFDCRWITNDDMSAPLYCAHHVKEGTSWCSYHHDVVKPPRSTMHVSPEGLIAMRRAGREAAEKNRAKWRSVYDVAEVA